MSALYPPSVKAIKRNFEDKSIDVNEVIEYYQIWVRWIFYVMLQRFNFTTGAYERVLFRGVKRGDEKYSFITCRKFDKLKRVGKDLVFFSHGVHGKVKSSCILMTLEYNANFFDLRVWLQVGKDLNRFLSRIRKRYGKISSVRVFESHESGYPHIHVLVMFHDFSFSGVRMYSQKRERWLYRIYGDDLAYLKKSWVNGYTDFECIESFVGGIRYLSKYLSKSTSCRSAGDKGIKTLALCWVFHKRSFSISGDLFKVNDEISILCNSNWNSSEQNSEDVHVIVGVDLYGNSILNKVTKWELMGFCVRDGVKWDDWKLHKITPKDFELMDSTNDISERSHYRLLDGGIYA